MKILKLIISNPSNEKIREIEFNETGTSVIYGQITKPNENKETSNSIGKTLLLKFIDYIFGANEDHSIVKKEIDDWHLEAIIKYEHENYIVNRTLGSSELKINGTTYQLTDYKNFFNIKRSIYTKQIFIKQKSNIISSRSEPVLEDYESFLSLLDLNNLASVTNEYYKVQDKLKDLTKLEKELLGVLGNIKQKEIKETIFLTNQNVQEKEKQIIELNNKIASLEISHEKMNLIESYSDKNYDLKKIKSHYEAIKLEINRLKDFIEESNKVDISHTQINLLFNKAEIDIPEMIKKRLEEVEGFYNTVFYDRKNTLNKKVKELESEQKELKDKINKQSIEIDNIAKVISANKVFQEAINIYEQKSLELQQLKYNQGDLARIDKAIKNKEAEEINHTNIYNKLKLEYMKFDDLIKEYQEYIYSIVQQIYTDQVKAYFSLELRNKHKTSRPFKIELNLTGDAGEGVGEVKKLIIDLLIFEYNNALELLIQDSSCYSGGIDKRQIASIIKIANNIALKEKKQFILSINDFQVKKDDNELMNILSNRIIDLAEDNKLLKFTLKE